MGRIDTTGKLQTPDHEDKITPSKKDLSTSDHPRNHPDPSARENHRDNGRAGTVPGRDRFGGRREIGRRVGSGGGITGAVPTGVRGDGGRLGGGRIARGARRACLPRDQIAGKDIEGGHLLLQSLRAIPRRVVPLDATERLIALTRALLAGRHGGSLEFRHNLTGGVRNQLRGRRQPEGQKPFETDLIAITRVDRLTRRFRHGVRTILRREKGREGLGEEAINSRLPFGSGIRLVPVSIARALSAVQRKGTNHVIHICGTHQVGAIIVCPLDVTMVLAIGGDTGRVGNMPGRIVQQRGRRAPVPDLLGPICICLIPGEPGESSGDLEQGPIGDGVLDGVAALIRVDLPSQASLAGAGIPPAHLIVVHALRQTQPGRGVGDIRVFQLRGRECRQPPEGLIIVSLTK